MWQSSWSHISKPIWSWGTNQLQKKKTLLPQDVDHIIDVCGTESSQWPQSKNWLHILKSHSKWCLKTTYRYIPISMSGLPECSSIHIILSINNFVTEKMVKRTFFTFLYSYFHLTFFLYAGLSLREGIITLNKVYLFYVFNSFLKINKWSGQILQVNKTIIFTYRHNREGTLNHFLKSWWCNQKYTIWVSYKCLFCKNLKNTLLNYHTHSCCHVQCLLLRICNITVLHCWLIKGK